MKNTLAAPITVVDYDPSWPSTFETLKPDVLQALGSLAASVEHVGSTSVPGLQPSRSLMDRYIHGKTDFLVGILRENGFPEDVLAAISNANRMKS